MSDSTPATDPNALLFPAFICGPTVTCQNETQAKAKAWREHHKQHGNLPDLELIPVPPGSVMMCFDSAPEVGSLGGGSTKKHRWHFYLIELLRWESWPWSTWNREYAEVDRYNDYFEAHVCRYSWGALNYVTTYPFCDSIDTLALRIEGVLSFWEPLDTLKYVHHSAGRRSLQTLLAQNFQGHIAMWVDAPTGDARQDLRAVVDKMRRASPDETHSRLIPRLQEVAKTADFMGDREWLLTPATTPTWEVS